MTTVIFMHHIRLFDVYMVTSWGPWLQVVRSGPPLWTTSNNYRPHHYILPLVKLICLCAV